MYPHYVLFLIFIYFSKFNYIGQLSLKKFLVEKISSHISLYWIIKLFSVLLIFNDIPITLKDLIIMSLAIKFSLYQRSVIALIVSNSEGSFIFAVQIKINIPMMQPFLERNVYSYIQRLDKMG